MHGTGTLGKGEDNHFASRRFRRLFLERINECIDQGRIFDFASMFPEKGFTCMQSDLSMPESIVADSEALMHHFESRMLAMSSSN